jgi:sorting nexin-29
VKVILPIHKKGDKIDCSNYRGISLLSTSYKILTHILLPRLTPKGDEIIGEYQCGFHCNRSRSGQIFYIRQILEKKSEYNGTAHQLFINLKKAYGSVRTKDLCGVLIEFRIIRKPVGLIHMF